VYFSYQLSIFFRANPAPLQSFYFFKKIKGFLQSGLGLLDKVNPLFLCHKAKLIKFKENKK
jgi:hypothetical protein